MLYGKFKRNYLHVLVNVCHENTKLREHVSGTDGQIILKFVRMHKNLRCAEKIREG